VFETNRDLSVRPGGERQGVVGPKRTGPSAIYTCSIAKGCELLKAYPTAAVSIDDGAGILIFDEESFREKWQLE
jgi:hypothetical protein